jgi:AraC-like DNA-binding protein
VTARYAEFAPRADLAAYVACVWVFEGRDADEDQRIAPDGCCELIIHRGEPYLERGADGGLTRQPPTLLAGQLTRPLHLRAEGDVKVVGVRFRTTGAHAYAGVAMNGLTDRRSPLPTVTLSAVDEVGRLAQVQDHVAAEIARHGVGPDPRLDQAVAMLEAGATVEALCRATGLSARGLQRRFAVRVGISPRMVSAIIRFRRVFEALREATTETWSDAAQAAGYFDHPQMARDFRRFVGCTPSQFVAGRPGLAASLVDLPLS